MIHVHDCLSLSIQSQEQCMTMRSKMLLARYIEAYAFVDWVEGNVNLISKCN